MAVTLKQDPRAASLFQGSDGNWYVDPAAASTFAGNGLLGGSTANGANQFSWSRSGMGAPPADAYVTDFETGQKTLNPDWMANYQFSGATPTTINGKQYYQLPSDAQFKNFTRNDASTSSFLQDALNMAPLIAGGAYLGSGLLGQLGSGAASGGLGGLSDAVIADTYGSAIAPGALADAAAGYAGTGAAGGTLANVLGSSNPLSALPGQVSTSPAISSSSLDALPGQTAAGSTASGAAGTFPQGTSALPGILQSGGTAATTAATGTALSRAIDAISNGTMPAGADLASILGSAAPGIAGALGSYFTGQNQQNTADQYLALGAPSRARLEASMTPGFDPMSIPGYKGALDTTSQSLLAKLSAAGGNPYGNPGGLLNANTQLVNSTALPAIQNYQNLNAQVGFNPTALGTAATAQTGANAVPTGVATGVGSAVNSVLNPQSTNNMSLSDFLKMFGGQGNSNVAATLP